MSKTMSGPPTGNVCIVIPTYNEKESLGLLIEKIKSARVDDEQVLFVDDSSPDGTGDLIRQASSQEGGGWIHLLSRKSKMGIGSAYLDGFREAMSNLRADIVVEMDADLQHPPAVIPELVNAVALGGADVAVGSRYVKGGGSRGWGLSRRTVSKGANWLAHTFLGLQVRDCTSGFRAYRKSAAQKLVAAKLPASGFEFQVAALHALKDGFRFVEVPYTFEIRKAGVSKLKFKDIVRFLLYIIWEALG